MYRSFKNKLRDYKQSHGQENWSPDIKGRHKHRLFTVKQQKQAHITATGDHNHQVNCHKSTANNINNSIRNHIPDTNAHCNLYTTTKGGSMTPERLLNFINPVIIKDTDRAPAALFLDAASINRSDATRLLDSLGYQHNDRTIDMCNKHTITVYRTPPNTTGRRCGTNISLIGHQIYNQHYSVHVNSLVMHSMWCLTGQLSVPGIR